MVKMNIKNIAIVITILYIIATPTLIIESKKSGYQEGFSTASSYYDSKINSESPLNHYKIGDKIKNTEEYYKYFNNEFYGTVYAFNKNGVLIIIVTDGTPFGKYMINEYWTEPVARDD